MTNPAYLFRKLSYMFDLMVKRRGKTPQNLTDQGCDGDFLIMDGRPQIRSFYFHMAMIRLKKKKSFQGHAQHSG